MVHAEPVLPLGDLLERLEALEGRLRGQPGGAPSPPRGSGNRLGPREEPVRSRSAGGARRRPAPPKRRTPATKGAAEDREAQSVQQHLGGAPIGADDGPALERWRELFRHVERADPALAAVYAGGRLVRWDDADLVLSEMGEPDAPFRVLSGCAEGSICLDLPLVEKVFSQSA